MLRLYLISPHGLYVSLEVLWLAAPSSLCKQIHACCAALGFTTCSYTQRPQRELESRINGILHIGPLSGKLDQNTEKQCLTEKPHIKGRNASITKQNTSILP